MIETRALVTIVLTQPVSFLQLSAYQGEMVSGRLTNTGESELFRSSIIIALASVTWKKSQGQGGAEGLDAGNLAPLW